MLFRISETELSALELALEIAGAKYEANAALLRQHPGQEGLAKQFDRQESDAAKLLENLRDQANGDERDGEAIAAAEENHACDDCQIDPDAIVSWAEDGAWVQGWLWVSMDFEEEEDAA